MRRNILTTLLSLAISVTATHGEGGNSVSEYIIITVRVEKDSLKAGDQGKLLFTIKPRAGFHVNVEPAISLELSEPQSFTLLNKKFVPDSTVKAITTKDGYKVFNPEAPVIFAFKVAKSLKSGKYALQAKLTYYYCNDAEGWCSFTTENFPVSIRVVTSR